MFDKATRQKLRFESPKGLLTTEEIWDLPLQSTKGPNLDDMAKSLDRQVRESGQSFVDKSVNKGNDTLNLKFEIIKAVIGVRLAENAEALDTQKKLDTKKKLLEILAKKQDAGLEQLTEDQIKEMIAKM